jgi:RimJ/RimL family protein N-acetyltransferase
MITKPTLQDSILMLRPINIGDIEPYLEMLYDKEGARLTGTQVANFSREQTEGWIASIGERDDRIDLAIVPHDVNQLVGEVVLNNIDTTNRSASIRIAIRTPFTNRGYGRAALRLLIAFAFEQLGLHRVELEVFAFNPRALHVYEQLGFRREGVLRDVLFLDGAFHDAIVMSILEDEYRLANNSSE